MRTELEIMDLIISTAKNDKRIRAVIMNGSRANPNAPRDMFQDYDIVYIVNDIESFTNNHDWIDIFGERLMLQMPEKYDYPHTSSRFAYLILFNDGNRIDLTLVPTGKFNELDGRDSESILLLDKDNVVVSYPLASDSDYHITPPTKKDYDCYTNDFWWCSQNVAKGIWRDELSYVMYMYNDILRDALHYVVDWYIGIKNNFSISTGKSGKYYKNFLDERQYDMYVKTYSNSDYDNIWGSLFIMCDFFRELAKEVASHFDFIYPQTDDNKMMEYLKHIKELPKDVREIY